MGVCVTSESVNKIYDTHEGIIIVNNSYLEQLLMDVRTFSFRKGATLRTLFLPLLNPSMR